MKLFWTRRKRIELLAEELYREADEYGEQAFEATTEATAEATTEATAEVYRQHCLLLQFINKSHADKVKKLL
jgi:hypothetical protein